MNFQFFGIRTPVPPLLLMEQDVCENVESTESVASVSVFSGQIQVSVRASTWISKCLDKFCFIYSQLEIS